MFSGSYRNAFFLAVAFHICLGFLLLVDPASTNRPVLVKDNVTESGQSLPIDQMAQQEPVEQPEIVKAVSVDSKQVMQEVNRLKEERANQTRAENARQAALQKQAEQARRQRQQEEQRLAKIKEEADKVAIARKKQIEEEQKRLKELATQKEQEAKQLAALKLQQQELEKKQALEKRALEKKQETEKLAALKKKEVEEAAALKEKQAAEEEAKQRAAAREASAKEGARQARVSGEVDRYKALIVNAISSRWILPENVDKGLSSQFRIRLAPDGEVLEVSLIRSSGDTVLDRSAQTAIYKASPLPVPGDPEIFSLFRDITLTVRPENVRG